MEVSAGYSIHVFNTQSPRRLLFATNTVTIGGLAVPLQACDDANEDLNARSCCNDRILPRMQAGCSTDEAKTLTWRRMEALKDQRSNLVRIHYESFLQDQDFDPSDRRTNRTGAA